jgi:hypothetical protein
MIKTARWNIDVFVDRDDAGITYAEAMLHSEEPGRLSVIGTCRRSALGEAGPDTAIAAAGALNDLARKLLGVHEGAPDQSHERREDIA